MRTTIYNTIILFLLLVAVLVLYNKLKDRNMTIELYEQRIERLESEIVDLKK